MQGFLRWLLYQLPEAFLSFYVGFRLLGVRPEPRRFWAAVSVFALAVPVARSLPFTFGTHTVILFALYVVLGIALFRVSPQTAVIAGALAFFLLSLGSTLVLAPLLVSRRIAISELASSESGYFVGAYLSASVLVAVALLVGLFRFRLFSAPEAAVRSPSVDRKA